MGFSRHCSSFNHFICSLAHGGLREQCQKRRKNRLKKAFYSFPSHAENLFFLVFCVFPTRLRQAGLQVPHVVRSHVGERRARSFGAPEGAVPHMCQTGTPRMAVFLLASFNQPSTGRTPISTTAVEKEPPFAFQQKGTRHGFQTTSTRPRYMTKTPWRVGQHPRVAMVPHRQALEGGVQDFVHRTLGGEQRDALEALLSLQS